MHTRMYAAPDYDGVTDSTTKRDVYSDRSPMLHEFSMCHYADI